MVSHLAEMPLAGTNKIDRRLLMRDHRAQGQ
jgi:hypothetical protein